MIHVSPIDEVFVRVDFDDAGIGCEIRDQFSFMAPNYRFHPKFKAKIWNGKINLFNLQKRTLYRGLIKDLAKFALDRKYSIEFQEGLLLAKEQEDLTKFLKGISHFEYRDYQIAAIQKAIQKERLLLLSPTASGKSLIIYSILRYYNEPSLLIVPTINLVGQMKTDFKQYAKEDPTWHVDEEVHEIYGGRERDTNKTITISTWQSLHRLPEEYFKKFKLVIVDEAHTAKSASLKEILEKMKGAKYRFGTTGTLDGMVTNRLTVEGLLGPVFDVTTTKKLMEQGHLATLQINCAILKYSEEERKAAKKFQYIDETDFLINHERRNKFIVNLTISLKNNTLLLFNFIDRHGKVLFEMINNKLDAVGSDRKVFFVSGDTDAEVRNDIRGIVEKETDAIIVASAGVFAQGINIKNLTNIIFAHSGKSRVRTLQAIGRVLRIGDLNYAKLYDIVDDIGWKSRKSYSIKHFMERAKIYNEQRFSIRMIPVDLTSKNSPKKE